MRKNWRHSLTWMLITAAFVGPGTLTVATEAGTTGGVIYLPVVLIAAIGGYLLMEMVARIGVANDTTLGRVVRRKSRLLALFCWAAVTLGCAAYQAGNLSGAWSGVLLISEPPRWGILIPALAAGLLMWTGKMERIALWLGGIVALVGVLFFLAALLLLTRHGWPPAAEAPSRLTLVLALIGTTIVPYNFFLAAGIGKGQSIGNVRLGLTVSFLIGGLITAAIVFVGAYAAGSGGFTNLAVALGKSIGGGDGSWILAIGLFVAGFSSATTAPLAAALAGQQLLATPEDGRWGNRGIFFRGVWLSVLVIGLVAALFSIDLYRLIVAAQFANGLLLPLLIVLLLYVANDRKLMGGHANGWWQNAVAVAILLFILYRSIGAWLA